MKSRNIMNDLHTKSPDELRALFLELSEKRRLAHLDLIRGKSKNPADARRFKKDIARVLTVANASKNAPASQPKL